MFNNILPVILLFAIYINSFCIPEFIYTCLIISIVVFKWFTLRCNFLASKSLAYIYPLNFLLECWLYFFLSMILCFIFLVIVLWLGREYNVEWNVLYSYLCHIPCFKWIIPILKNVVFCWFLVYTIYHIDKDLLNYHKICWILSNNFCISMK